MSLQVQHYVFLHIKDGRGKVHTNRMLGVFKEDCGDPAWVKEGSYTDVEALLWQVRCLPFCQQRPWTIQVTA